VRGHGHLQGAVVNLGGNLGRDHVVGAAVGVLGFVVVEALARPDLGHRQGALAHDRHRELAPGDELLDHKFGPRRPLVEVDRRQVGAVLDDPHADAGALVDRLDDEGPGQRVARSQILGVDHDTFRTGQAGGLEQTLGGRLVHGQGGGQQARVGVGNAHQLEDALDAAILAPAAVQRVEDGIGRRREGFDKGRHVVANVDFGHLVARLSQTLRAGVSGDQRNLSLGRGPAHQNCDSLAHVSPSRAAGVVSACRPMRRISHGGTPLRRALPDRRRWPLPC
jgi:hypothetical protein